MPTLIHQIDTPLATLLEIIFYFKLIGMWARKTIWEIRKAVTIECLFRIKMYTSSTLYYAYTKAALFVSSCLMGAIQQHILCAPAYPCTITSPYYTTVLSAALHVYYMAAHVPGTARQFSSFQAISQPLHSISACYDRTTECKCHTIRAVGFGDRKMTHQQHRYCILPIMCKCSQPYETFAAIILCRLCRGSWGWLCI